jgi:hypothetical protein
MKICGRNFVEIAGISGNFTFFRNWKEISVSILRGRLEIKTRLGWLFLLSRRLFNSQNLNTRMLSIIWEWWLYQVDKTSVPVVIAGYILFLDCADYTVYCSRWHWILFLDCADYTVYCSRWHWISFLDWADYTVGGTGYFEGRNGDGWLQNQLPPYIQRSLITQLLPVQAGSSSISFLIDFASLTQQIARLICQRK